MRRLRLPLILASVPVLAGVVVACERGGDPPRPDPPIAPSAPPPASTAAIDPETCRGCHEGHVTAWSGSMHAYATDDPVFLAMEARGQRETGGALGNFCVSCHAPLAVANARGAAVDPKSLPRTLRGVTCFFCHSVDATLDLHDGALRLAGDGAFRGAITDPVPSSAHASMYSPMHDRARPEAAATCGACHDVRMPSGADLERTYAEWATTVFAQATPEAKTCGGCHMPGSQGAAASVAASPVRTVHDHTMAALDVPLGSFPETAPQRKAVQLALDSALTAKLCVIAPGDVQITLENSRIGHAWPTGATHDRRAWVELRAFAGGAEVWSRGAAANDLPPDPRTEPDAILLGGTLFDAHAAPVKFLWQAASTRTVVLAPKTSDAPGGTHPLVTRYAPPANVDRVTMRVRVTPFAPEVLDDLVASGDLAASVRGNVPTFSLASTTLEWTKDRGYACVP